MGNRRAPFIALILLLAAAPGARADDPHKGAREAKLKELDAEVGKLVKLVKNVDLMVPCGTAAPATQPAAPAAKSKGRRGRPPKPNPAAGKPFCPADYKPIDDKIKKLIGEVDSLNDGNPGDDRAGWVRSTWPQYRVSFATTLDKLAKMKAMHHDPEPAEQQCQSTEDAALARAKAAAATKSLDEFYNARYKCEQEETDIDNLVATEESHGRDIDQLTKDIMLFQPPGQDGKGKYDTAWKPVYQALQGSAKKMQSDWKAKWGKAYKICELPAQGEDNPEHHKIEDQFYADLKKGLETELDQWRKDMDKIYQFDCDNMKKMYSDYCDLDGDGEEEAQRTQLDANADKLKADMTAKLEPPEKKIDELSTRALKLQAAPNGRMKTIEAYRAWVADIDKYRDELKEAKDGIDRVRYAGLFQGSRNPKLQMWATFGVQRHKDMEAKFKCTLGDEPYCEEREVNDKGEETTCKRFRRPDCVMVEDSGCSIIEFKPDSPAAKKLGMDQLNDYKKILDEHYNKALDKQTAGTLNYSPVGGSDLFAKIVKSCAPGGKIDFKIGKVEVYPKCDKS
ncbi:MAG TPA: hypothetical protein VL172_22060, partial [Kofleriaceae bacterium]|nr:hypothetical protein [Kofleriaceae bacterium]